MIDLRKTIIISSLFFTSCSGIKQLAVPLPESGVSRDLAVYRKTMLNDIRYVLEMDIPENRDSAIHAREELKFELKSNKYPLQLDFREDPEKLKSLRVNGVTIQTRHQNEHLILNPEYLKKGENIIEVVFEAGETALNRNKDFLYTLLVPDRARTVFPCFDQPDLKATYKLTLKLPIDWKALANAPLRDSAIINNKKCYWFNTSDTLSTYLFSFAAGKFSLANNTVNKLPADFLYRETDPRIIKNSLAEIFNIHSRSLKYLEEWTGIPYPFQKFGFVAIPDFQFGGMEHVGAIQYKASALFLDEGATKDQLNSRNNLIAHETAHMWFGDLVTMNWFSDVWMKEVFANFMADKSTGGIGGKETFDLKFLIDHFPAAYGVDRTRGSNPIRQELDNLKDAGTLYGNVIYHKAPIMMRQLELLMGKEKFQLGVREYLKRFANGNASWPDLISILDKYADADLQDWNKVWVEKSGRPIIDYSVDVVNDKINRFIVKQRAEYGAEEVWPQLTDVTLYYPDSIKELRLNLNKSEVELEAAKGLDAPTFILFNSTGQGYGVWPMDKNIFNRLYTIKKPLARASVYLSLYENMLNGRYIKPGELLDLFIDGLAKEDEELNLKLITNYISIIYWEFISAPDRRRLSSHLENALWSAMKVQNLSNNKKILFKTYQDIYISSDADKLLRDVWDTQKPPLGLKLTEDDYTSLAFSLSLRNDGKKILEKQLSRIINVDRKKRFMFIMPAVSFDERSRDAFFKSLELKSNREKESNVVAALYYLHHPLRQTSSFKYLPKSLEMVNELQKTGDIFFPQNWLQATFGYYQSTAAVKIVEDFFKENPSYNPKLKAKILQCTDNLFRAEKLLRN